LKVGLGWQDTGPVQVFDGWFDKVESTGSRERGRHLALHSISNDPVSLIKSVRNRHADNMTLSEALNAFANGMGVTFKIDPKFADIKRDYWSMGNESLKNFSARIAKSLGGRVDIQGETISIVPKDGSGDPSKGPTIIATVGQNVISWNIVPFYAQAIEGGSEASTYDPKGADWSYIDAAVEQGVATGTLGKMGAPFKSPDATQAKEVAEADKTEARLQSVTGSITINGEPRAVNMAKVILSGARPQIDGTYQIRSVVHVYTRGGGYTTELHIQKDWDLSEGASPG
jgi:uncharacterized protein